MGAALALAASAAAASQAGAAPSQDGAAPEPPRETARTVELDGISVGMGSAELVSTLVARGFVEKDERRQYLEDENGGLRKRVVYRDVPGLVGPTVHEIDHTVFYPVERFDADEVEREIRRRFGEPSLSSEGYGRLEMIYLEDPDAPKLGDVLDACKAELLAARPELSDALAEARAHAACQYRPENRRVEIVCPGTVPLYERFARFVEAPQMRVSIWREMGRVDTRLRWGLLQVPFRGMPGVREKFQGLPASWVPEEEPED